ncbi:hypothetical protein [Treponema sp.]|uniref:hypothetical protein n=1 Tax=Treponema sp. TaxID=166 RepID=UPI0025E7B3CD|nr:hypothetical protein [Treponema sp.]MCR5218608.1 hypothetical protein [Treponema sp.]
MLKEELEKEARAYTDNKADKGNYDYAVGDNVYFSKSAVEHAYVAGAEPREKRITEIIQEANDRYRACQKIDDKQNKEILDLKVRIKELEKENTELKTQIEEMKRDTRTNIKWADQHKNNQMYCKLNAMINQWEIKENDRT